MSKLRQQHMPVMWHDLTHEDSDTPAVDSPLTEKASLIGRIGLLLLASGAGAYRVRAAMNKISRALKVTCNADIGIKSISYTCIQGNESCTNALSNRTTGVNTSKLNYLEMFCDGFTERAGRYSIDSFHNMLDTIDKSGGNYAVWQLCLASGAACGAFAFLLGAGWIEILCTFAAAAAGFLVRKLLLNHSYTLFANVSAAVLTSCFTYIVLIKAVSAALHVPADYRAGYICSILFIVPGFPLITGGIDIAKLDLKSGIERIVYSLMVVCVAALTCAFTASLLNYSPVDFPVYELDMPVKMALRLVMSFVGVFGFSMLFNSTPKMALTAGLMGMIANFLRLLLTDFGLKVGIAAFVGAFLSGIMASAIKGIVGIYPRITLTVPSIVIMVPGMFLYKGIHFLSSGDFDQGGVWLWKAIMIIASLPLGLVFARIITDKNFAKSS